MKTIRYGKTMAAIAMLLLLGVTIFLCVMPLAKAEPIDTYHSGWHLVRATASEDSSSFADEYDLTGVTSGISGTFADMNSSAFHIPSRNDSQGKGTSPGTKWVFAFSAEAFNAEDDTFSFNLVGWAKDNGMLHNIAEGSCTLGTQAVGTYPHGGDALGRTISSVAAVYTHADLTFTMTDLLGDAAVGMYARVTGTGFVNALIPITTVTSNDSFVCSTLSSTENCTATVQINPAFWVDTIDVDELTKWSPAGAGDANTNMMGVNVAVLNSGDNEVGLLIVDLAGLEYIQFIIYDADAATNEEAGFITVLGRPY